MEEELNEDELEERLYAMIHYVDDNQANVEQNESGQNVSGSNIAANPPRSTVRRYWRTSGDLVPQNSQYQKVNTPNKDINTSKNINKPCNATTGINNKVNLTTNVNTKNIPTVATNNKILSTSKTIVKSKNIYNSGSKEVKKEDKLSPVCKITNDLSIFNSPPSSNIKTTIKILESDSAPIFDVETSDEDEVVEVALPPKPTITIESSDEDEVSVVTPLVLHKPDEQNVAKTSEYKQRNGKRPTEGERDSASPVPSIVSSVSDEFIRGDCIAWNISSRHQENPTFDFSLHGTDLVDTPSRKKKKKKNKERTSTPLASEVASELAQTPIASSADVTQPTDECFATPKNKSKNKKQKTYAVSKHSIPNPDVYDSDSNQSTDNQKKSFTNTEKSLPNPDVYESDSSQSEVCKKANSSLKDKESNEVHSLDSSVTLVENKKSTESGAAVVPYTQTRHPSDSEVVDLTDDAFVFTSVQASTIEENIVMANVTGFEESNDYGDDENNHSGLQNILGSTKIPAILSADLDFDNLKGKENSKKRRRYSLTSLRTEMEKFYNESWGGEDFNHKEIQKNMPRDKSLWEIDPKDRMPTPNKRKVVCNFCNRTGHRDDMCRLKPPVCHMCGIMGHYQTRCPHKICVNCGSPNYIYSTICRNCSSWGRLTCAECRQPGHPASHCPDLWRRYHNTITNNSPLIEMHGFKKYNQQFCSGCTRRGHFVHTCRVSLPFSGLPINSPYVVCYRPLHPPFPNRNETKYPFVQSDTPVRPFEKNKRQSKSPAPFETQAKKRMTSTSENSPANKSVEIINVADATPHRPGTESENKEKNQSSSIVTDSSPESQPAPDFIPIPGNNHDKLGQMIQDNEVSDTSDVVTSARIYVTNDIMDKISTEEGSNWLKSKSELHSVIITPSDVNAFLNIKGKLADQEAFQAELRDWTNNRNNAQQQPHIEISHVDDQSYLMENIPKKRNSLIRKLNSAFESLKSDLGDPKTLFKELKYFQNSHTKLIKQKVISPQKLSNNKGHINEMLKKLNMVLLGQAGLADGSRHLSELYSLQEKLIHLRHQNIPTELRKEIGRHYHCIFNSVPRNDYQELLNIYYTAKQAPKTSKHNTFKVRAMPKEKKTFNANQQQNLRLPRPDVMNAPVLPAGTRLRVIQKTVSKLTFFRRRLLQARPNDTVLKKTRQELLRKLHTQMSSLDKKDKVTSKTLKKMKKLQTQASLFLANSNV